MRIAYDARKLTQRSGTGMMTSQLLKQLTLLQNERPYMLHGLNVPKSPIQARSIFAFLYELVWKQVALPVQHKARGVDVTFHPYPIVPILNMTPSVAVIYDLLCHAEPSERSWSNRVMLASLRLCASRARFIVTISEFSKSQIVKFLRVPSEKVIVAYPGCDHILSEMANFRENATDLLHTRKYILSVLGSFSGRKNAVTLVKAYQRLPSNLKEEYGLVIVASKSGRDWFTVNKMLKDDAELRERISIMPAPTRHDLLSLYLHSSAVLHVTLYEGFGIPIIEAMAFGKPVIASRIPPIVEIVNDNALLVDPTDCEQVSSTIVRLFGDSHLENKLSLAAKAHSSKFEWKTTAKIVSSALSSAKL